MDLGAQFFAYLFVRPVEVYWWQHVVEAASGVVSEREVWILNKSMVCVKCFLMGLEGVVDDDEV